MRTAIPDVRTTDGGMRSFGRIVLPVAGCGLSSDARALAMSACDPIGGMVRVVHVRTWELPVPPARGEEGSLPFFVQEEIFDETPQEAAAVLEGALREIQALGVPANGVVIEAPRGRVASVIASEATTWGAQAIIVTRRARRALGVLLFGSIADQVTREVACPVLVARPDGGDPNRHPSL